MYELIQVGSHTYYIDCPAKMGVYLTDETHALLIDSGNDKSAAKKVLTRFAEQGWTLTAVLNTHSHADHIGGNKTLIDRTGCTAYAPGMEAVFTRSPLLEPSLLYGGCPPKAIWTKFLYAEPSNARELTEFSLPAGMEVIPLPGHSKDMVGYRTPDNVIFLGDSVMGAPILEKYGVTYLYNVPQYLESLDRVEQLKANCFVPAHAEATEQIRPLVRVNRAKTAEITAHIRSFCDGADTDAIIKRVFDAYGLTMNLTQYTLIGSTVRSYLSMLSDQNRIAAEVSDNRLLWRAIDA